MRRESRQFEHMLSMGRGRPPKDLVRLAQMAVAFW